MSVFCLLYPLNCYFNWGDHLWQSGVIYGPTDGPRGTFHSAVGGLGGLPAVAKDGPGRPIKGGTIRSVTGLQLAIPRLSLIRHYLFSRRLM